MRDSRQSQTWLSGVTVALVLLAMAAVSGCHLTRRHAPGSRLAYSFVGAGQPSATPPAEATQSVESTVADDSDDSDDFDDFGDFDEEFPDPVAIYDPLSGYNRAMFHFNDRFYLWILKPPAKAYRWLVPEGGRVAIGRAFTNFKTPVRFVNDLLQLRFDSAGSELGRLVINSTLGVAGLFDAADGLFDWQAPPPEDFGQTLGHYGVGPGFPLVIPFLGPSNLRDGIGLVPDSFLNPAAYYVTYLESIGVTAAELFNYSSLHIGEYESLKRDSIDPYVFFRDAYQQRRNAQIQE